MDKYKIADAAIYKTYVETHCIYGMTHFCDGTPNFSRCHIETSPKPPCKYIHSFHCPVRSEYETNRQNTKKKTKNK